MSLYCDASVIVPAIIEEPLSGAVAALLQGQSRAVLVSDFAAGEFASAVARRFRMAELTAAEAQQALIEYDLWSSVAAQGVHVAREDIANATALVRRLDLKLRLPDAIHLAICMRLGLTLATLDLGLANAARALGAPHIVPA